MLKNLKNNKKKGFTLVELIVVLVILAILAALLIPALTGYINKAKEKSLVAETRQVVMAVQTIADEQYAKLDKGVEITTATIGTATDVKGNELTIKADDIKELAEVDGLTASNCTIKMSNSKVSKVVYKKGNQKCTYNGTSYEVEKVTQAGS